MTSVRPLRLLLCAAEAAGVQLLRSLARLPEHRTVAVLTNLDSAAETVTVASVAKAMDLQLLRSQLVREASFADWIRENEIDLLLNVHSLYIAHADVVRAPASGSFNLHPGPLPRYAGLNAPSWAIFNGEQSHGVTVHWMDPEIDTGPIAFQSLFDLDQSDTGLTVSMRCVRLGVPLVLQLLEVAGSDPRSIPAIAQDLTLRTYYGVGAPNEGNVCWSWTAAKLERFVRASDFLPLPSPWGHPAAGLGSRTLGVCGVAPTGEACSEAPGTVRVRGATEVEVATGDEWLRLVRLSVDGELVEPARVLDSGDVLEDGRSGRG
jgi:methionyl-tRNA formyltransferase